MRYLNAVLLVFTLTNALAQSDGPRAHLPTPVGVWALNVKYLSLDQNLLPNGNLYLVNAQITAHVMPITVVHSFSIKSRWARVSAALVPVFSMQGNVQSDLNLPRNSFDVNGISDGFVSFELNVFGNQAMKLQKFAKTPPTFTLNGQFRVWYPGSYKSENIVNLGTNRFALDLSAPMQIPLGKDPKKGIWLETWPGIQFYTANTNPTIFSKADKIAQTPLFYLENHFSFNIKTKFYAGADLRLQHGGETKTDGVNDGNRISLLGGGLFLGYKPLPFLDFFASYDSVLWGDGDVYARMFRFSLTFSYLK